MTARPPRALTKSSFSYQLPPPTPHLSFRTDELTTDLCNDEIDVLSRVKQRRDFIVDLVCCICMVILVSELPLNVGMQASDHFHRFHT